ncbi:MAG TPA: hypothetical protein VIK62_06970 [Verrucomicrobiae bacterium]
MKLFAILVVALALGGKALADVNYDLGKKQAKRDANQNDAQQGVTPAQPQSPAAPQAPPADPALLATLQNIADLRADLDAINQAADAQTGADQRASLMTHLSAAAAHDKKAATASIKKLAAHLIATTSGNKKLTAQNAKLARSFHAAFNGAHLSATQQQTLLDGVKKNLTDAGVTVDNADNVVADLKQIAAETQ